MEWTAGKLNVTGAQGRIEIESADGLDIGCAYYDKREMTRQAAEHNARLFAASPTLERALYLISESHDIAECKDIARKALAAI